MTEAPTKVSFIASDPNTTKLAVIAELLGVDHELITTIPVQASCIVLRGRDFDAFKADLSRAAHFVLVYDIESSLQLAAELRPFPHSPSKLNVTRTLSLVTGALSGLSIPGRGELIAFREARGYEPLIEADSHSVFMTNGRLFITSATGIPDLNSAAQPGHEPFRELFAELFPFLMFLRHALPDRCWRLAEHCATMVIDDPLLRRRYGCIEFDSFLDELKSNNLAATFAFIPWNRARTDPKVAGVFRNNSDRLSICVHGCDHTGGEFAETDPARLDAMLATALARMRQHEADHRLPFDPIMVFPQGKFSREALDALARTSFTAAVNTSAFPVNYKGDLRMRDLLDLAPAYPTGIPVWRRRYPVDTFDFACDLFLQRPVIIVQHHQDFAAGFTPLLSFIEQLRAIKPDIKWKPLGQVLVSSLWQRVNAAGETATRTMLRNPKDGYAASQRQYTARDSAAIASRRYLSEFRDAWVYRKSALIGRK